MGFLVLMANYAPKIIDLYSGVGGLSLGAIKSNFNLIGAVEREVRILNSHAKNFPFSKHINADISTLSGKMLSDLTGLKRSELAGLIGGPPCQGFSTIGKKNIDDVRNKLFSDFFRLVLELKPAFFLAENVPGILNKQYDEIRKGAIGIVENDYDVLSPIKINASEYGAATIRTRVFFIGVRRDIKGSNRIHETIFSQKTQNAIYVEDALNGLPVTISEDWIDYTSSWQKIEQINTNDYLRGINRIVEDLGDQESINRFLKNREVSGCFGTRHSQEVATRYSLLIPGQQDSISKSVKLKQDGFCPTLRAGTDNTRGSFQAVRPIHPTESRVITPREAARLQGFPDWFQFHETKWHSFRQIGNSVCPIAAEKVLAAIKTSLNI